MEEVGLKADRRYVDDMLGVLRHITERLADDVENAMGRNQNELQVTRMECRGKPRGSHGEAMATLPPDSTLSLCSCRRSL